MNPPSRRYRMLHLTVHPSNPIWPKAALELQLNQASDWIRYAENSWLLWTDYSAQEWHALFREKVPALREHQYLILGVDISERQGLMPQVVWEWISQHEGLYRKILLEMLGDTTTPQLKRRRLASEVPGVVDIPEK